MIVSNEPGYYKSGGYGIRLENLVAVVKDESFKTSTRPFLAFETLTIVPFERTLIATNVLSLKEREWIDTYHARVWKCLQSEVDADTRAWLEQATRPLI
jgi:Xaa-Pro aminopeptidase